jgi:hypothetical protein
VAAELRAHMREQEKREDQFLESLPDFRQFEDCREVTDPELAVPLYMLMEARGQYLQAQRQDTKEELTKDMLKAIAALERALLAKWMNRE